MSRSLRLALSALVGIALVASGWLASRAQPQPPNLATEYTETVLPLLKRYCLDCHSTKAKKGSLDLERFASIEVIRRDLKPWQQAIEQVEASEMPPKEKPQPTAEERRRLLTWIRQMLDAEARARVGDPGHVPLRRLSNAEYDATIRELTGVDLRPTREFPADGAAGEGFTNAAEALTDVSPALLTKYLNAARDVANHAVLVPDGLRFSPGTTRRDWMDENVARLRRFYAETTADGKIPLAPYLLATVRHRDALLAQKISLADIARTEKLNLRYLTTLWKTLAEGGESEPLNSIRVAWSRATEKDVTGVVNEIVANQAALWKTVRVGNYFQPAEKGYTESLSRQVPASPTIRESQPVRVGHKPTPGQGEVTLSLLALERSPGPGAKVLWERPRFEAAGKPPLLLSEYARWGAGLEGELPTAFADSAKYLAAVADLAQDPKLTPAEVAKTRSLDPTFLQRWVEVLAVVPVNSDAVPAVALTLLDEKTPPNAPYPAIRGWRKKGTDLPVVITNSSDMNLQIPGRVSARGVSLHPMPQEFVGIVWKAPIAGTVEVGAKVSHAHPACGNGVACWLQHRRANRATPLGDANIPLGQSATLAPKTVAVEKGDLLVLAVDAKEGSHNCDMTEVSFRIAEVDAPKRVWFLADDIATSVQDGNPHADGHGHPEVWSFVRGASKPGGKTAPHIQADSVLGRWRSLAADPKRLAEATPLAEAAQKLLTGPQPMKPNEPDRVLYDRLVTHDGPLFVGVDLAARMKPRERPMALALPKERFSAEGNLVVDAGQSLAIRLPAALFVGREFVAEGRFDGPVGDRFAQFRAVVGKPETDLRWDARTSIVGDARGPLARRLQDGFDDFRKVFPLYLCFPQVIPADEVVSLKTFHREDEPLIRLFLDDDARRRLDALWTDHRFISRQPVAENDHLEQFIQYVTQDQPKEMLAYFQARRPVFQKRADEFLKDEAAAIPKQIDALLAFAGRAYRRPLLEKETADLRGLYASLREKGSPHDEALRATLSRVLIAPAYLFRIEQAPAGKTAGPIRDRELATRLSYFLWSSGPDAELRRLADEGGLRNPATLAEQTRRMLKDERVRMLAIEFGTQWIHVRGFDQMREKNEKLFPTFDANLRSALYEESIRFFQDLFQADRSVNDLLDSDATYLNATLAKHYAIPGVTGSNWQRVEGVKKFGRGGILGLGSVLTAQAGASRTSPVLRGNWVVETLLGEKLPRPPANVPRLPEEEGTDQLTVRQQVEKHARQPECATCHQRIDPFGFALERYDPIGRRRDRDAGGLAVDSKAKLKDGTEFDGIDGLRAYLLSKKKDAIERLFCRKLLGYALGRSVSLSDTALIDEMVAEMRRENHLSAAVLAIVRSPQFRMIRGRDFDE